MNIELWPLERLVEYAGNPRKNDHAVEAVAKAIEAYGFNVPILARSTGEIIDGHLRYKAARHLGLESIPVIIADHLSEAEVRAFRVSVNKVAELAKWDMGLLMQEMQSLSAMDIDLSAIGFSEVDLDGLLSGVNRKDKDPDSVPDVSDPVCRQGDLWRLGNHLLFVGDCTVESSFHQLFADCAGGGRI